MLTSVTLHFVQAPLSRSLIDFFEISDPPCVKHENEIWKCKITRPTFSTQIPSSFFQVHWQERIDFQEFGIVDLSVYVAWHCGEIYNGPESEFIYRWRDVAILLGTALYIWFNQKTKNNIELSRWFDRSKHCCLNPERYGILFRAFWLYWKSPPPFRTIPKIMIE